MRLARNLLSPRLFHNCLLQSFTFTTGAAGAGSPHLSGREPKEMYCWTDPSSESDVLGIFLVFRPEGRSEPFEKEKSVHKKFCAVHISGWMFRPALLNAEIKALGIHGHFQGDTATPACNLMLNTGLLFILKFSFVLQSALFWKERGEEVIRFSRISGDEQMQAQLSWSWVLYYSVCIPEEVVKENLGQDECFLWRRDAV